MDEQLLRRAREKFKAQLAAERALHEKRHEDPLPAPQLSLDDVYDLINLADNMSDD